MEDDDAEMQALIDRQIDYYFDLASVYNLYSSIWAIFEVDDFLEVPYPAAETIRLHGVWTDIPKKSTWLDLWRAADMLMYGEEEDDDADPPLIVNIEPDPARPTELVIDLEG